MEIWLVLGPGPRQASTCKPGWAGCGGDQMPSLGRHWGSWSWYRGTMHASTLSQGSSPEMGMAASRMSELPVPGGVCMKAEWLKSGHCRRNANIRGDMGAFQSWATMVLGYMLALKSHQWNPGCWDGGLTLVLILHSSSRTMCVGRGEEGRSTC